MNKEKQEEIKNKASELIAKYTDLYKTIKEHGFKESETIAIYQEVGKSLRSEEIQQSRIDAKSDTKPTQKQITFAQTLGIENPESMTKQELSFEIDKHNKQRKF